MTIAEAKQNIGREFKVSALHGGILGAFDTIVTVSDDGIIYGTYIEASASDCRLKGEEPENLKIARESKSIQLKAL